MKSVIKGKKGQYSTEYVDKTGKQTLSSYDAVNITFDNRLKAAEIRKET
jgi:hypothetical protein